MKRLWIFLKRTFNYLLRILAIALILIALLIVYASWKIDSDTKKLVFDSVNDVPAQKTALILGTARYMRGGENPYFTYRIQAAKELYEAGKVSAFVVSGDNMHRSYNEPREMRKALIDAGVPDSIIYADYAGFRTLDSVVRMKKVFQQDSFIIVSQRFHNERAVFIARSNNIEAYGYNAKDLGLNRQSVRTKIRERLARVKVFIDLLIDKQPRFLGEPIEIK